MNYCIITILGILHSILLYYFLRKPLQYFQYFWVRNYMDSNITIDYDHIDESIQKKGFEPFIEKVIWYILMVVLTFAFAVGDHPTVPWIVFLGITGLELCVLMITLLCYHQILHFFVYKIRLFLKI